MSSEVVHLAALAALAGLAGCATTVTLDSKDDAYVRGLASFDSGRCAEARESLTAFIRSSCFEPEPASGCQRGVWMKMQCSLKEDRPAQAIADSYAVPGAGPPRPELQPSTKMLAERARAILDARWASADHPAKIEAAFVNEAREPYSFVSVALALDQRPVPPPQLVGPGIEAPVFAMDVPAGDHLLSVNATMDCDFRNGRFRMVMKSSQSFSVKAGERVRVVAKTYLKQDVPPLALPYERVAVDFVITPDSARDR